MINSKSIVKRGEIYFANLGEGIGSEQKGERPVLIIQNNTGNKHSPTTIVALITSVDKKADLPVHYEIKKEISSLSKDSIVLLEQLRTIDKSRLTHKVSVLDQSVMQAVDSKILISLGLK